MSPWTSALSDRILAFPYKTASYSRKIVLFLSLSFFFLQRKRLTRLFLVIFKTVLHYLLPFASLVIVYHSKDWNLSWSVHRSIRVVDLWSLYLSFSLLRKIIKVQKSHKNPLRSFFASHAHSIILILEDWSKYEDWFAIAPH